MAARRKYSPKMKANIVFKAIRSNNASEVAREYGISPNLVSKWRKDLIEKAPQIFDNAPDKQIERLKRKIHKLEQIIGQKEVEINLIRNFADFYESPNGD
ncbi:transposase [Candidatus Dojkabacteria bacterium]|nr:transposase [Candidatus Dojkabacteria bacterium]